MYARRLSLPAALSTFFLLLLGLYAGPAHADVDVELIGETLSQEGYYVDSGSKVLRSDAALDRLRGELESGIKQPVFVTVLPAGAAGPGLASQLARQVGRKGTYAVLVGSRLEASSTALPQRAVNSLLKQAVAANKGDPEAALIQFARSFKEREEGKTGTGKKTERGKRPRPSPTPTETVETQVAAQPTDDGGPDPLLVGGLAALAVALAGGAFFWWRRRSRAAEPVLAGGPSGSAGGPGEQAYGQQSGYDQQPYEPLPPLPTRQAGGPTPGSGFGSGQHQDPGSGSGSGGPGSFGSEPPPPPLGGDPPRA
jgi:hypothetical protein